MYQHFWTVFLENKYIFTCTLVEEISHQSYPAQDAPCCVPYGVHDRLQASLWPSIVQVGRWMGGWISHKSSNLRTTAENYTTNYIIHKINNKYLQ